MKLHPRWKQIVKLAWSVRFIVLAFIFTVLEIGFPLLDGYIDVPRFIFAGLAGLFTAAAFVARIVAQANLPEDL